MAFLQKHIFAVCILILLAVSLYPIVTLRFLPMQDYPQHLFLSQVINTFNDPAFNWKQNYNTILELKPYMLWYLLMKPIAFLVGVELAGKALLSAYLFLITALIYLIKRSVTDSQPWGAVLFYPLAFNQIYYMGFSNYLLSLPLIFILLLDLEKMLHCPPPNRRIALHLVGLLILLLNHPYSFLVYAVLAITVSAITGKNSKERLRTLVPAITVVIVFIIWYVTAHSQSSSPNATPWSIKWWPPFDITGYYLLMFTGMRLTANIDWLSLILWYIAGIVFINRWIKDGRQFQAIRLPTVMFLVSFAGFLILPFLVGYYSYFNIRLAPVSYFAGALVLSRIKISQRAGLLVVFASLLLLFLSIRTQAGVSREVGTILPVIEKMQPNAMVLPLYFDSTSKHIDPVFFYEIHAHEANYYHIIKGGGANPTLFPNAMMPVQYSNLFPKQPIPKPDNFLLSVHELMYDYFLVRSAHQSFIESMLLKGYQLSAKSDQWTLFEKTR